jgi:hypothetical protein
VRDQEKKRDRKEKKIRRKRMEDWNIFYVSHLFLGRQDGRGHWTGRLEKETPKFFQVPLLYSYLLLMRDPSNLSSAKTLPYERDHLIFLKSHASLPSETFPTRDTLKFFIGVTSLSAETPYERHPEVP